MAEWAPEANRQNQPSTDQVIQGSLRWEGASIWISKTVKYTQGAPKNAHKIDENFSKPMWGQEKNYDRAPRKPKISMKM